MHAGHEHPIKQLRGHGETTTHCRCQYKHQHACGSFTMALLLLSSASTRGANGACMAMHAVFPHHQHHSPSPHAQRCTQLSVHLSLSPSPCSDRGQRSAATPSRAGNFRTRGLCLFPRRRGAVSGTPRSARSNAAALQAERPCFAMAAAPQAAWRAAAALLASHAKCAAGTTVPLASEALTSRVAPGWARGWWPRPDKLFQLAGTCRHMSSSAGPATGGSAGIPAASTSTSASTCVPGTGSCHDSHAQPQDFSSGCGNHAQSQNCSSGRDSHAQPQDNSSEHDSHGAASTSASTPSLMGVLPAAALPYAHLMRLDKPIGTWLLAWPCAWSIALAAEPGGLPDMKLLGLFAAGALLLRGAGCTVNDLWDRDLDKKVERTRNRPLASGALSASQAIGFLALQLSLGLAILLQLNDYSKVMGAASLLLVGTYPLMKRVTFWPQAFLGLTINWGALMGYAAAQGTCDWPIVLPLYAGAACWTIVYDTIYAHQDTKDDSKIGIRSTALLFGENTKAILSGFAAASILGFSAAGAAAGMSWPYYAGTSAAAVHMAWQLGTVDLRNGPDCMAKFVSNKYLGGLMFAGAVAGKLYT
mmetsp:Transcript_21466/g.64406  ORF Transcript_21466/g.64406 Transcript_21466/m.64406 type:complete len:588 (-) Transcript_21466:108-1871(-)